MEYGQICADVDMERLEARNGLLQFDEIRRLADVGWANPGTVAIDDTMVQRLHAFATDGIFSYAGTFRTGPVGIGGTGHVPPPASDVPGHIESMTAYVAANWSAKPVHLCSFLLWRCNWIHPFFNGNGRTTRGLAYLAFLLRLGYEPGGAPTFVDMISADKRLYYSALDDADAAWAAGKVDVSSMEAVVSRLIAAQLMQIVDDAGVSMTDSRPAP